MFGHLWVDKFFLQVHLRHLKLFHYLPSGVVDTCGKFTMCLWYWGRFAGSIVVTGGKFATDTNDSSSKIYRRCHWNRWHVASCHQLSASVDDASGKFTTCVIDSRGAISPQIFEKV